MIELRVVTQEDWALWRRLRLSALAEAPHAFVSRLSDWQGEGDREERWRARLAIPGSHNLVAELDGEPVGITSGVPGEGAGVATLISMWVSPQARGRGVADRLIGEVERWALQTRAEVLKLAVTPGNEHAIVLYRRNGFDDAGEPGDLMPDGSGRERVLSKKLR
ncbi:GNAT family N-acetyltransferase [Planotetraspora thailandica]|uniref:GNAT family N-acetyltransferase n=1 Tax=Planotetraspora thailandica TaxID=487172 RepID=UPI001951C875|nr:GNAT family N-acetyltransferase [Planotetraspora thailandica]